MVNGSGASCHRAPRASERRGLLAHIPEAASRACWQRSAIGITIPGIMSNDRRPIAEILAELRSEHRDLDRAIAHLSDSRSVDQLQLTRLKKRKLRLKDQIAYWESRQIPDLDA